MAAVALAAPGLAAPVTFTDQAAFRAAAAAAPLATAEPGDGPDIFEDFNSIPLAGGVADLFAFADGPFTLTETGDGVPAFIGAPETSVQSVNGTTFLNAPLNTAIRNRTLTFTFDSPIIALGYFINPNPGDVGAVVDFETDVAGQSGSYLLPAADETEFRGFLFEAPVTDFTIEVAAVNRFAFHGIDDVEAYTAAAVPEPTSMALLGGSALLGLAGRRFRRRRAAA